MRKKLGILILAIGLLMAGCGQRAEMSVPTPVEPADSAPVETTPVKSSDTPSAELVPMKSSDVPSAEELALVVPGSLGIAPGKAHIGGLRAGGSADVYFNIHNGTDTDAKFAIYYEAQEKGEFVRLPESEDWVTIAVNEITVPSGEYRRVDYNITVPEGIDLPDKWAFTVNIIDVSQEGASVAYAMGQVVLVDTAKR